MSIFGNKLITSIVAEKKTSKYKPYLVEGHSGLHNLNKIKFFIAHDKLSNAKNILNRLANILLTAKQAIQITQKK